MYKIYIKNKPLYLTHKISNELEEISHRDDTIIVKEFTIENIQILITKMQEAGTNAGIFLQDDVEKLLSAVKKEFLVIKAGGGLVYSENRDLLLIFRRGKWDLPKGKLDEGETFESCAVREVQEETGLKDVQLQQLITTTYHTYYENGTHCLKESHWFLMLADEKQSLSPQIEEDIEKCEWVKIKGLSRYLKNAHASVIDVITAGVKIIGEG